jgi:hypothetical protein
VREFIAKLDMTHPQWFPYQFLKKKLEKNDSPEGREQARLSSLSITDVIINATCGGVFFYIINK